MYLNLQTLMYRYGRWNKVGIVTYVVGVLIQLPFISTGFYTGPLVEKLGGVDISWIVGLVATSIIYYIAIKNYQCLLLIN